MTAGVTVEAFLELMRRTGPGGIILDAVEARLTGDSAGVPTEFPAPITLDLLRLAMVGNRPACKSRH